MHTSAAQSWLEKTRKGQARGGLQPRQQVMVGIREDGARRPRPPKGICELQRRPFFGRSGRCSWARAHTPPVQALFVRDVWSENDAS
jgi:hypothetical protein